MHSCLQMWTKMSNEASRLLRMEGGGTSDTLGRLTTIGVGLEVGDAGRGGSDMVETGGDLLLPAQQLISSLTACLTWTWTSRTRFVRHVRTSRHYHLFGIAMRVTEATW